MSMQLTNADLFIFGKLDGDMIPVLMSAIDKRGMTKDWVIDQCHRHARIPGSFFSNDVARNKDMNREES